MSNSVRLNEFNEITFPRKYLKLSLKEENISKQCEELLNKRIELNNYSGWVRFCGELKGKHKKDNEIWIGVDWDDESRGKHKGTVDDIQYFSCEKKIKDIEDNKDSGNSGSLIKASKANFGQSFLEAINFKYCFDEYADEFSKFVNDSSAKELFIESGKKKIEIEFVGINKTSNKFANYSQIAYIDLPYSNISSFNIDSSNNKFYNLTDLTMTRTLISKWSIVIEMLNTFENLSNFNFSENKLIFDKEFSSQKEKFKTKYNNYKEFKLTTLILNKNEITFFSLKELEFLVSRIKNLYLYGNFLNKEIYNKLINQDSKLYLPLNNKIDLSFCSSLNLESNNISNLADTLSFFTISNRLKSLNLNNNILSSLELRLSNNNKDNKNTDTISKIDTISIDSTENSDLSVIYNSLESLFLDWNKFTDSLILLEIQKFINLENLFITSGNQFFTTLGLEGSLKTIIGRLLNLKILNNNIILKTERKEYEVYYLKKSVSEFFEIFKILTSTAFNESDFNDFMGMNHPNYYVLRRKYFNPVEDILWNMKIDEMEKEKEEKEKLEKQVTNISLSNNNIEDDNKEKQNLSKAKPSTHQAGLLSSLFSISIISKEKTIVKKFPKTTTFSTIRSLVSKLFKINEFSISIEIGEEKKKFNVIDEGKTLDGYDLVDQSVIYIDY